MPISSEALRLPNPKALSESRIAVAVRQLGEAIENRTIKWIGVDRPLPIQLDITNACNLRCVHCYHADHNNRGLLSAHEWLAILQEYFHLAKRLGYRPSVIFCGGEPLLSPHFGELAEKVQAADSHLSILTNGVVLDRVDLERLSPKQVSFQVSLDGACSSSHDKVRGVGNFEKAISGIRELKRRGYLVQILAVLSKRSSSSIPSFFRLAQQLNADEMNFTRMISNGYAKNLIRDGVDRILFPQELKHAYLQILESSAATGIRTATHLPLMTLLAPGLGRSGRFWEGIVIDYQGNFLASSRSRIKLGNLIESSLESLFLNNELYLKIRRGQIDICGKCRHFKRCGGDRNAAYGASGNYLAVDPGCWLHEEASSV